MNPLDTFFKPKTIAVIGASHETRKVGHFVYRNLVEGNLKGKTYPVNPTTTEIFDQPCYPSVLKIREKIDLAIITVPAAIVPKVLTECGKKKIPAVIIISAGFAEIGNTVLDNKVKRIIRKYKMRVLGPNCLGVFDPSSGVDTLFLPRFKLERPKPGGIGYISQSGATGSVVLDWMAMKGYSISKFISYGNAMDIDEADLTEYLAEDNSTKVICIYFEGVREGRKFFNSTKNISNKKPIVALKGGRTKAGQQATLSHTGSLAGESRIYDAVFKQAGIIKAEDLEQIFHFARVLATQPKTKGKKVQIITNGGGYGVLTSDWVVKNGLEMAEMEKSTVEELKKNLPSHVVIKNPIDLTGDADTERYRLAIDAAINDPGVDMIAVIPLFQIPTLTGNVVEVITEAKGQKPMVVIAGGGKFTEALKKSIEDAGIPTFSYPEQAIASLKALYDYSRS